MNYKELLEKTLRFYESYIEQFGTHEDGGGDYDLLDEAKKGVQAMKLELKTETK